MSTNCNSYTSLGAHKSHAPPIAVADATCPVRFSKRIDKKRESGVERREERPQLGELPEERRRRRATSCPVSSDQCPAHNSKELQGVVGGLVGKSQSRRVAESCQRGCLEIC